MGQTIDTAPIRAISARLKTFISDRETQIYGQQKLSVYLYASVILIGIVPLIRFTMPKDMPMFLWPSIALWCATLLLLFGYYVRIIPLPISITLLAIFAQTVLMIEMIHSALSPVPYSSSLLLANLFLSLIVALLSAIAYMKYMPYLLSAMAMGAYAYSMIATGDTFLQSLCAVFLFIFLIICLLGTQIRKNIVRLNKENEGLRNDELELLKLLRMNKSQVKALLELSKSKSSVRTGELLDMVDDQVRHNIIHAVSTWQRQKEIESTNMSIKFPELTNSEREICALILQDKKQNAICMLLNKSASNINSQRAHIRKKLGLRPQDDLKAALRRRMDHE